MRLTCPACNAETSLEVLLGREVDARAFAGFIERRVVFGELMVRYIGLFRPEKRRLALARVIALAEELLPDIERGAINHKGRDWAAPHDSWRYAFMNILAKRDAGELSLPLTSHGLLYSVMVGTAEKYERRAEAEREENRRNHRQAGAQGGPRNLADAVVDLVAPSPAEVHLVPPAPMPPAPAPGPSRAALAIKAQNDAYRQRHSAAQPPAEGAAP